ncbi:hypothetical protein FOCC_FOCC013160 [Frankliniella occidentalis]|uniref:Uncharacterized protein LOC113213633 n=1 Tax=Frankliniella occidentalis TaxID=133901 RepID=A0A6J1T4L9_FRAOC|nr:uncharacterized protein LOC113213633 [Frankliniella occidentalis]KAE8741306.1 hypothetical protein FOCC_FOCC013160 [Frankliniella occidentalis]
MKTIMRTALLACMLLAALQFAQASPRPNLSAALTETKVTSLSLTCIAEIFFKFLEDVKYLMYMCVQEAENDPSLPFIIKFPICAVIAGGADLIRIATMDAPASCL